MSAVRYNNDEKKLSQLNQKIFREVMKDRVSSFLYYPVCSREIEELMNAVRKEKC